MAKFIFLDSAPLSVLSNPTKSAETMAIAQWVIDCDAKGHEIVVPEIIDYELRRVFLLGGKVASLKLLDGFKSNYSYLPITTDAMLMAAKLWADARRKGRPTAHEENIGVDVILAA